MPADAAGRGIGAAVGEYQACMGCRGRSRSRGPRGAPDNQARATLIAGVRGVPATAEPHGGILGQVSAIKMALNIDTPAAQMRNVVIEANALLGLPGTGTIPQQIAELFSQLGL